MPSMTRRTALAAFAACALATAVAFPAGAQTKPGEPLKIGFVYVSPIGDAGWTFQHDTGRKEMEKGLGAKVTAKVDMNRRQGIRRAHSATHIMHYALQKSLGKDAHQMGSKVEEDWLRFDFGNPEPVSAEKLQAIEKDVAEKVAAAQKIVAKFVPLSEARTAGAMMLFGEKYGETVRMITFDPAFSRELCGGCHVQRKGQIGFFKITADSAATVTTSPPTIPTISGPIRGRRAGAGGDEARSSGCAGSMAIMRRFRIGQFAA